MIHLILLTTLVVLSVLAVELDEFIYSILSLAGVGVVLGLVFFNLGAIHVSLFQILICGGAVSILFFVLINLTEERGKAKLPSPIKIVGIEVPGFFLFVVLFCLIFGLLALHPFNGNTRMIESISTWVWNYRLTDTIAQAFILFSTLVGILVVWWSE